MPHAWSKPKSWTCHCSSFRAFKNLFFQLKEPKPVEEGLLDMIKTAAGFFSVDSVFFHVHHVLQALTLSLSLVS